MLANGFRRTRSACLPGKWPPTPHPPELIVLLIGCGVWSGLRSPRSSDEDKVLSKIQNCLGDKGKAKALAKWYVQPNKSLKITSRFFMYFHGLKMLTVLG
jgi:hypothetical protein